MADIFYFLTQEYPGTPERGGQRIDSVNFVSLVKEMRQAFGSQYGISLTLAPVSGVLSVRRRISRIEAKERTGLLVLAVVQRTRNGGQRRLVRLHVVRSSWLLVCTCTLSIPSISHQTLRSSENADMIDTFPRDSDVKTLDPIVRGQADVGEIANDTLPLWFDGLDASKINFGLAYYGRGYRLTNPSCNTLGCPFSGASDPGTCNQLRGRVVVARDRADDCGERSHADSPRGLDDEADHVG